MSRTKHRKLKTLDCHLHSAPDQLALCNVNIGLLKRIVFTALAGCWPDDETEQQSMMNDFYDIVANPAALLPSALPKDEIEFISQKECEIIMKDGTVIMPEDGMCAFTLIALTFYEDSAARLAKKMHGWQKRRERLSFALAIGL